MSEPDSIAVVLSTLPDDERAAAIARALVDDGVAACVNLVPGVRSIYRWEGAVADDREQLAIIKTRRDRVDALVARLRELHPYQVPEAIVLPVAGGHAPYLAWVAQSVR
ncbi:MAG: divalent-cation tolerance protein CutA [Myxococcales bacterium]|nr:divalent-cation tolerance protein CutA [Myxococcales bacterium]